jgi:PIN domain nuclease of toxin-antitoxin system
LSRCLLPIVISSRQALQSYCERTKYARLAQSKQFVLLPFYPSHTLDFDACSAVTEMHDRMIAADARRINATLLTRNAQITSRGVVATVW